MASRLQRRLLGEAGQAVTEYAVALTLVVVVIAAAGTGVAQVIVQKLIHVLGGI